MATLNPAASFSSVPRVNLMPRAETERRERSGLLGRWAGVLVLALVVVAAATAGAFVLQFAATQRLTAENTRTTTLLTQLAGLSDVRQALDLEAELTTFRAGAMATDLEWGGLLSTVQGALPEGVVVTAYTLTPGGMPQGDDPALEVGVSGSFTLSSETPREIVPLIRSVRALPGFLDADGWAQTAAGGGYTYELRVTLDQTIYTGAYAKEATE